MGREIPHSPEMERAALGSMLMTGAARVLGLDMLAVDDFHDPAHGQIFAAISQLVQAGSAVDAGLVANASGIDSASVSSLIGAVPASMNAKNYVGIVAELGAFRRAIGLAETLAGAAYAQDAETVDRLLADPMAAIMPNYEPVSLPRPARELAALDYYPDFVIPGLLARLEILMVVGGPGQGKSTLLRQIAVCASSGLHPFTRTRIQPVRVLIIDCQESAGQAGAEIKKLLELAGEDYRDLLWIEPVPQGIDISTRRWQRWLDAKVAKCQADLVIAGPLYNMIRGANGRSKQSEETAELGMNALGDLMVRRNVALIVEAHSPHGDEMRVRGSKLWEDWPDFGFGLVTDDTYLEGRAFDRVRFRGDRHHRPAWPSRFLQGHPGGWPWEGA